MIISLGGAGLSDVIILHVSKSRGNPMNKVWKKIWSMALPEAGRKEQTERAR